MLTHRSTLLVEENEIRPIEFKLFYWMDLIQLFFLSIMYWISGLNLELVKAWFDSTEEKDGSKSEQIGWVLIL
jgi:hypothetical protein